MSKTDMKMNINKLVYRSLCVLIYIYIYTVKQKQFHAEQDQIFYRTFFLILQTFLNENFRARLSLFCIFKSNNDL
jgi:hypothetical protein